MTPLDRYDMGWMAGAVGAGRAPEFAGDDAYERGYRHGERDHARARDSFLAAPDQGTWPSRAVLDLYP